MGLSYKNEDDIVTNTASIATIKNAKNFTSVILKSVASQVWTNEPAALTEILGTTENRTKVDLTNVTQYRLMVNLLVLNAEANALLGVQYSLDDGSNWFGLDNGTADTVSTLTASTTLTTGFLTHAWANITALAKVDVLLRVVGLVSGGGGTGDPDFAKIEIQFK